MNVLYFDCAAGISGDMTLGALLDLGVDEHLFLEELAKLHVDGYTIQIEETQKNGIRAKHVNVLVDGQPAEDADSEHAPHDHGEKVGHEHPHDHGEKTGHAHHHEHRTFADIRRIIEESGLAEDVKALALRIFGRVAKAEAKVHGKAVDEVHFHEVGAVDSIVDIVGCAILIHELHPQAVYASVIHEGHGFVHCQHGMLTVPVPATSEILAAAGAPLAQIDIDGELVTPTGAAIITELAQSFGDMPAMEIEKIGWGAGTKNFPIPNVLKVYAGRAVLPDEKSSFAAQRDEIVVLQTNLDDCTGEMLGHAMDVLMKAGALDVSYTPIFMKKNRPAYCLTVLARPDDEMKLEALIFQHTTTIGIRKRREVRSVLTRERTTVSTPYGEMGAKKVFLNGKERIYPEYESAVKLTEQRGITLWEIYNDYE